MAGSNKKLSRDQLSVNGYLSNIIHDQKVMIHEKDHSNKETKPKFCSNCINDDLTKLDITV